jgi:Usg protein, probable subunit of phosphoribosylanthranilate isomerase
MVDTAFLKQLEGYGLTTAEIHYHLPDTPSLLQLYVWQDYDVAPAFPTLQGFLDFWTREIEGALHSVRVAHSKLIRPAEFRPVSGVLTLH